MNLLKKVTSTVAALLMGILLANDAVSAQEHVVRTAELQQTLLDAAQARSGNLARTGDFFRSGPAAKALKSCGIEPGRVVQAASALSDEELAQLSTRIDKVNKDFAGGALSNQDLTYIVIALATAVLILVIVAAR
jgi:hypothetical protein